MGAIGAYIRMVERVSGAPMHGVLPVLQNQKQYLKIMEKTKI
jgi:hypothetical protein